LKKKLYNRKKKCHLLLDLLIEKMKLQVMVLFEDVNKAVKLTDGSWKVKAIYSH